MGVLRGTLARALESDRAPKYQPAAGVSGFDAFTPNNKRSLAFVCPCSVWSLGPSIYGIPIGIMQAAKGHRVLPILLI